MNLLLSFQLIYFSGGLEAVTYTDVLQCTIMLIGAVVLTILGNVNCVCNTVCLYWIALSSLIDRALLQKET